MRYFLLFVLLTLVGCDTLEQRTNTSGVSSRAIPPGATDIEYIKDKDGKATEWGKFTLDGQIVYFSDAGDGYQYIGVIGGKLNELPTINGQPQIECPHCHSKIVITPLGPVHLKD